MTITNEERRKVAAMLREIENDITEDRWFHWEDAVCESWHAILKVASVDEGNPYYDHRKFCNRLADLIEPERVLTDMELAQSEIMLMGDRVFISGFGHYTKERTCKNVAIDGSFKCSECKSFVECNDYAGSAYICDGDWNFCPNCGRKVID